QLRSRPGERQHLGLRHRAQQADRPAAPPAAAGLRSRRPDAAAGAGAGGRRPVRPLAARGAPAPGHPAAAEGAGRGDPAGLLRGPGPRRHRGPDRAAARHRQVQVAPRPDAPAAGARHRAAGPALTMASPTTMTASTTAATGTVHCAPDALLLAFATGSLNEPLSLLVESHAALNPVSRRRLCEYEAIGGALLEELPPAPLCPEA